MKLAVCSNIEKTAGCIVGTGTKGVAIREELNGVDVGVVSCKRLDTFLLANIPELGKRIAGTRHKLIVVKRVDAQAHDIAQMVCKFVDLGTGFQVPENTSHVTRRGKNTSVADETAATEVSRVSRQFTGNTRRSIPR